MKKIATSKEAAKVTDAHSNTKSTQQTFNRVDESLADKAINYYKKIRGFLPFKWEDAA